MATRGTKRGGIQGAGHAIDVATALRLDTLGTAELPFEADRRHYPGVDSPTWSPTVSTRWPPTPATSPALLLLLRS